MYGCYLIQVFRTLAEIMKRSLSHWIVRIDVFGSMGAQPAGSIIARAFVEVPQLSGSALDMHRYLL